MFFDDFEGALEGCRDALRLRLRLAIFWRKLVEALAEPVALTAEEEAVPVSVAAVVVW